MNNDNNLLLQAVQNSMFFVDETDQYPYICALHNISSPDSHNCLACNFADLVINLESLAKDIGKFSDQKVAKITFILWLYLLAERMQEVLRLLSFPEEIKGQKFIFFQKVKRWGNFLKHPKAFLLTHHPKFEGVSGESSLLIDDDFITRYYGGDKHNVKLYELLTNKINVDVKLPDLIDLTKGLGNELQYLCDVIFQNPIFVEILTDKSVFQKYYGSEVD